MPIKLHNQMTKQKKQSFLYQQFAKKVCRLLYFCGLGNFWYEHDPKQKIPFYKLYSFLCHFYMISVVTLEILGNFKSDLTLPEKNNDLQLSIGHSFIYAKLVLMAYKRKYIKNWLQQLFGKEMPCLDTFEKEIVIKVNLFIIFSYGMSFVCILFSFVDGFLNYFQNGTPVRMVVTYWPDREPHGVLVEIIRVIMQFVWVFFITCMLAQDTLFVLGQVVLGHKFKALCVYFEQLRNNVIENPYAKDQDTLEKEWQKSYTIGLKLHDQILRCARNLQSTMGGVLSLQVVQGIILLVICLLRLVPMDKNLLNLLANLTFTLGVITVTGLYMIPASDITYEASLVPTAMFHSGWELSRGRTKFRALMVVSILCAGTPVYLTAFFGIFRLSYSNYIQVLRLSYSFFAVMI